jgi:hypothetical protein
LPGICDPGAQSGEDGECGPLRPRLRREAQVDGKSYPVCKKHHDKAWKLFKRSGWLYAVDLDAKK